MKPSGTFEVYEDRKHLYTKNLVPGKQAYGENLVREGGEEYREWDARRSKLASVILKGSKNVFIRKGDVVLYLGAASGTTVSHVSDMVGADGFVFAVDFAPRVVRDLYFLSQERPNIAPILADAHHPESYVNRVCMADIVYQDIAQKNQLEIFLKNCRLLLKDTGYALLAVKAKSIDVTKKPKVIFEQIRQLLDKQMIIIDSRELYPYQLDHCMFICKNKTQA